MTIRHLQIFRTVCACRSVTAAAEKLGMTQPAVSIAVRELESYYQTRLFDRMNRRIFLTEAGETLLQYANAVLDSFDEAAEVLRDGGRFKECRLGVNVTVAETVLPSLISCLRDAMPDLKLKVTVGSTQAVLQRLTENGLDLALTDGLSESDELQSVQLFTGKMAAVGSKERYDGSPLTVEQLAAEPLLLQEKGSGNRNCVDALFIRHGLEASPAVESVSTLALIRLAAGGEGLIFLPEHLASEACARYGLRVVPLADEKLVRRYYLLHSRRKYLTDTMKKTMDIILREGRNLSESGEVFPL